jgi:hypothetical protein
MILSLKGICFHDLFCLSFWCIEIKWGLSIQVHNIIIINMIIIAGGLLLIV